MIKPLTIADRIPTYRGPFYYLAADAPIPKKHMQEIRRAVAHSCVKTQGAFLAMMLDNWAQLRLLHPNPSRFDHKEWGVKAWNAAHAEVCNALARAGETPQVMQAYASDDHKTVNDYYRLAAQSIWGGA